MTAHKRQISSPSDAGQTLEPLGFRPLYGQVKAVFLRRLADGAWPPGALLPSEGQLAAEIGVSQGTVRKALDELAAENLLVRRQGRGTFVAEHDERRILFQFFKLAPDHGEPRFPESTVRSVATGQASADERTALQLDEGARVVRIERLRSLDGAPLISETIALPARHFPGLENGPVPNNLYGLYARVHGVIVATAQERLKAVALDAAQAALLQVPPGTPALLIDRLALALDGVPVERRLSLCLTENAHYRSDLR